MTGARVLLIAGSPNDLDPVLEARAVLSQVGVAARICVASAHRTPELVGESIRAAEAEGALAIIAFAGMAAHLAGVAAAQTRLPVIGVPLAVGPLAGIDAALATLQMPPGTPVATVSIDGAENAALLAARIAALRYPEVGRRLAERADRDRERYAPEQIVEHLRARGAASEPDAQADGEADLTSDENPEGAADEDAGD